MNNNDNVRFVSAGEMVEVILESNASTGYVWQHMSIGDFEYVNARAVKPYNPDTMTVGSGIKLIHTLKPKREGELRLRFEMRRPWEKTAPPIEVHEEVIMVQK